MGFGADRDPTRLAFFSDAVFAIAITLLVLDIHSPQDTRHLLHGLIALWPSYPDEGEKLTDLQSKFPAPGIIPYIVEHKLPEGGNEFTLAPEGLHESFCADIPADDAAFYAITQRPLAGVALTEAAPTPA